MIRTSSAERIAEIAYKPSALFGVFERFAPFRAVARFEHMGLE
jgi:hypothetical protein